MPNQNQQNPSELYNTSLPKKKSVNRNLIISIGIIVFVGIVVAGVVLFNSAWKLNQNTNTKVSEEIKSQVKSKLESLALGVDLEKIRQTNPAYTKNDADTGWGGENTSSGSIAPVDKSNGYVTKFRYYGYTYESSSGANAKSSSSEFDSTNFDVNKYYDQVNVYSAEFNKSYIISENKYLNYTFSDKLSDIYYYGKKYAAKIIYTEERELYFDQFSHNVWILDSIANNSSVIDKGTKTIEGKEYRYFEIPSTTDGDYAITDTKSSVDSSYVSHVYLNKDDLSVFRIQVVNKDGKTVSMTDTLEEKKLPIADLRDTYLNTNEISGIQLKEVKYAEQVYKDQTFEELYSKYPIVYSAQSSLTGISDLSASKEDEYFKLFSDPDFIDQSNPVEDTPTYFLSYYENNYGYQVYSNDFDVTKMGYGDKSSEKTTKITIAGVSQDATIYEFGSSSSWVTSENENAKTPPDSGETNYSLSALKFKYAEKYYFVISYSSEVKIPTEYLVLTLEKAKEFDMLQSKSGGGSSSSGSEGEK